MATEFEPVAEDCPFCRIVSGSDLTGVSTASEDVVYRGNLVTAFIASSWWPANPGHVLVVPNDHYPNVYDIPDDLLAAVQVMGKRVALALRATYGCPGTSFRQHNDAAGGQDVWHYHLHVFPRYVGDNLYTRNSERRRTSPEERRPYVERLRQYFAAHPPAPDYSTA